MSDEEDDTIQNIIRKATAQRRGYADFFQWPPDKGRAELGIVEDLAATLEADGKSFFSDLKRRHEDPPDCEAVDAQRRRVAIEVTELVDRKAIERLKATERQAKAVGQSDPVTVWGSDWDLQKFKATIEERLSEKDARHPKLLGGPCPGGYVVVLHTDEAMLPREKVEAFAGQAKFNCRHIDRAFIIVSYDPEIERYPVVELRLER